MDEWRGWWWRDTRLCATTSFKLRLPEGTIDCGGYTTKSIVQGIREIRLTHLEEDEDLFLLLEERLRTTDVGHGKEKVEISNLSRFVKEASVVRPSFSDQTPGFYGASGS